MRLIPMDLTVHNRTIGEPHSRNALSLAPVAGPVGLAQPLKLADAARTGDSLNAGNFTENFKMNDLQGNVLPCCQAKPDGPERCLQLLYEFAEV